MIGFIRNLFKKEEVPTETHLKMAHHSDFPPVRWGWINFTPKEIASKGNGEVYTQYYALNMLQVLRIMWGKPLHLNSAYRDPEYNAKVGGATSSYHMKGQAFDVSVVGWTTAEKEAFKELAYEVGFTGFGGYDTFIHIDTGPTRFWGQSWATPEEMF